VIAVDTNVLVYAHRNDALWHEQAVSCLNPLIEGRTPWAVTWPSVHEFISVVTNRRIYDLPTPLALAFEQLEEWSRLPNHHFIGETLEHFATLRDIALPAQINSGMIHDARIAAICLQHGVTELWTADRDFSRFPKLKTRNPLVG
jgi:uncharacterized protein